MGAKVLGADEVSRNRISDFPENSTKVTKNAKNAIYRQCITLDALAVCGSVCKYDYVQRFARRDDIEIKNGSIAVEGFGANFVPNDLYWTTRQNVCYYHGTNMAAINDLRQIAIIQILLNRLICSAKFTRIPIIDRLGRRREIERLGFGASTLLSRWPNRRTFCTCDSRVWYYWTK